MTLTRPAAILTILIAGLGFCADRVTGQTPLPEAVSSASPVSQSDKDAIKTYVDATVDGLGAPESQRIRKSRNDLLRPLRTSRVSTDFRLEYSRQLLSHLDPMVRSQNGDTAINVLVVLGEIGTSQALTSATKALTDARPPVRLAAVQAFERTFTIARGLGPAIQDGQIKQALTTLEAPLAPGKETDPLVVDGFIRAFESAAQIPDVSMPGVRAAALTGLAKSFSARVQDPAAGPELHPAFLRAGNAMVDSFKMIAEPALPQQSLIEIGGFAGDLLAYALRLGAAVATLTPNQFNEVRALVGQAETIVTLAGDKLGSKPSPYGLQSTLATPNGAEKFRRDVLQVIGRGGVLTSPPFSLPPQRFLGK